MLFLLSRTSNQRNCSKWVRPDLSYSISLSLSRAYRIATQERPRTMPAAPLGPAQAQPSPVQPSHSPSLTSQAVRPFRPSAHNTSLVRYPRFKLARLSVIPTTDEFEVSRSCGTEIRDRHRRRPVGSSPRSSVQVAFQNVPNLRLLLHSWLDLVEDITFTR